MRTTRSGESALLLVDAVEVLVAQDIEYAVVGALAASVHGAVRASMDADVVITVDHHLVAGLEGAFRSVGCRTELTRGDDADPIPGMLRLSDRFDNRVDLLLGLRGLERAAFSRVVDVPFRGACLKFIGREDFIAMKAFAGGPLDLVDASRAIAAAGDDLDRELLRRLAGNFGRDAEQTLGRLLSQR